MRITKDVRSDDDAGSDVGGDRVIGPPLEWSHVNLTRDELNVLASLNSGSGSNDPETGFSPSIDSARSGQLHEKTCGSLSPDELDIVSNSTGQIVLNWRAYRTPSRVSISQF